jgi:hypothetical protein
MRILAWNCNLNFKADFLFLQSSDVDVLFIQECEKVPRDHFEGSILGATFLLTLWAILDLVTPRYLK